MHLNAYPHNFMCVYNNGIIVDVIIATQRRSNVLHFTQHIPSLRVFWTAKTPNFRYDLCTWEDQCLQTMYKQIGTIFWNSFVIDDNVELFWVTFDPSVATLSINTLWCWLVIVSMPQTLLSQPWIFKKKEVLYSHVGKRLLKLWVTSQWLHSYSFVHCE